MTGSNTRLPKSLSTQSYWASSTKIPKREALSTDSRVDIAIIGAGITGLTCAYTLAKQGKSVAVIEDGLIGNGETSRTSAHLCSYLDERLTELKRLFGLEGARLAIAGHAEAVNYIEKIVEDEKIGCDFKRVNGYLFKGKNGEKILKDEARVLEEMKTVDFEWIKKAPFHGADTGRCLKFPNQAQFHPLKYLKGLAKAVESYGAKIYESTHANKISDGTPCSVETDTGAKILADCVIVATNSPINERLYIQTKQAQYRTYMIGISLPKGQLEEGLYWDTLDPYHYIRTVAMPNKDDDLVLIGGEDHKVGQNPHPEKCLAALEKWAKKSFSNYRVAFQWSGQIIEPMDGLAFTGRNPGDRHVYVHTGDSGNGLTHGTLAGLLLPDLIFKKESPYENLLSPARKNVKAVGTFLKETGNMVAQYADWIRPSEKSEHEISFNEGVVVNKGVSKQAVYKDENGETHCMSAICPHLGGLVRWNSLEKTWDCPCHGSRFTAEGEVINGPANQGLTPIK